jgi:hypothetical protein
MLLLMHSRVMSVLSMSKMTIVLGCHTVSKSTLKPGLPQSCKDFAAHRAHQCMNRGMNLAIMRVLALHRLATPSWTAVRIFFSPSPSWYANNPEHHRCKTIRNNSKVWCSSTVPAHPLNLRKQTGDVTNFTRDGLELPHTTARISRKLHPDETRFLGCPNNPLEGQERTWATFPQALCQPRRISPPTMWRHPCT